jgi:ribosomal protein S18 acetylase RimI-like enzyme
LAGEKTAGFCIIWDFTEFVYLEHFAIEPDVRGLGIGEGTLALIKANFDKPVILETELPLDEISSRRIKFYKRNGFRVLYRHYLQPSYDGIKPEVEMKLMSTAVDFASEELDRYIGIIRKKVYPL